jgi:hypothetical protein
MTSLLGCTYLSIGRYEITLEVLVVKVYLSIERGEEGP